MACNSPGRSLDSPSSALGTKGELHPRPYFVEVLGMFVSLLGLFIITLLIVVLLMLTAQMTLRD
jgi:hypothetical protein